MKRDSRFAPAIGIALVAALASGGVLAQASAPAAPPATPPAAAPAKAPAICADCGIVQSVRYVEQKGEGSGLGAVAGGVLGGVLGHQVGGGTGKTLATIAGAGGGAYAGHQVEKNVKKKSTWSVALKMDNGQTRTFTYSSDPAVKEGERVKLVDGGKRLALIAK
jgi:outer membrane lipoprotein SlyB